MTARFLAPGPAVTPVRWGVSPQAIRDNRLVQKRMNHNGAIYIQMSALLELAFSHRQNVTRRLLIELAKSIIRVKGCPELDRLTYRRKEALICWFCENCPELLTSPVLARLLPGYFGHESAPPFPTPMIPATGGNGPSTDIEELFAPVQNNEAEGPLPWDASWGSATHGEMDSPVCLAPSRKYSP
jgi:hypothetical protein